MLTFAQLRLHSYPNIKPIFKAAKRKLWKISLLTASDESDNSVKIQRPNCYTFSKLIFINLVTIGWFLNHFSWKKAKAGILRIVVPWNSGTVRSVVHIQDQILCLKRIRKLEAHKMAGNFWLSEKKSTIQTNCLPCILYQIKELFFGYFSINSLK